ncbi:MAG: phosphoenolpyruvate--protein phosphotransferase [Treponema sp.]|jgi:phosphotransferase system enzyme I (PtsI)|nr:phosphoenolpyruvate--protein phosphotransferase [Treponema sp.]
MKTLNGISASQGVITGKAFLYLDNGMPEIPRHTITESGVENELARLSKAIADAAAEMESFQGKITQEMSKEQAAIFEAHLMMLEDVDFQEQLAVHLKKTLQNAEWVVWDIAHDLIQKMTASPDPIFRERAVDISDVSRRVLTHLLLIKKVYLNELEQDVILVAHDILPSELLTMSREHVKGIVTDLGGKTSHMAILARAFGIPAVLGLSNATMEINSGDTLVVDGGTGKVFVNPDREAIEKVKKIAKQDQKLIAEYLAMRDLPAETKDGFRVLLKANIEISEEAEHAGEFGAEGIGLYRSEFLFIVPGKSAEEETQFEAYSRVLKAMGGRPVTIRTVDIGGDKILKDFHDTADEKNPLLGWRAIRFSLALPELFKTQLRAILRASVYGTVKIMFPLISGIEELEQALHLLEEAKAECRKKGQAYSENIETGTMIEVPSAAMTADILAEKSDFFSIGTNDLIQYSLAIDRGNERVSYLAQPVHPAVLRFLKKTIDAAHEKGIKAAMCGEMAGDPFVTALLLGLGLDEFSMVASAIPPIKRIIRLVEMESCRSLAAEALQGKSWKQNAVLVDEWMTKYKLT